MIEKWRVEYNTKRPHSALGYRPPAPAAHGCGIKTLTSPGLINQAGRWGLTQEVVCVERFKRVTLGCRRIEKTARGPLIAFKTQLSGRLKIRSRSVTIRIREEHCQDIVHPSEFAFAGNSSRCLNTTGKSPLEPAQNPCVTPYRNSKRLH